MIGKILFLLIILAALAYSGAISSDNIGYVLNTLGFNTEYGSPNLFLTDGLWVINDDGDYEVKGRVVNEGTATAHDVYLEIKSIGQYGSVLKRETKTLGDLAPHKSMDISVDGSTYPYATIKPKICCYETGRCIYE